MTKIQTYPKVDTRLLILLTVCTILTAWLFTTHVHADIYMWKDADGITHFTNYDPPDQAEFHMVEHKSPQPAPAELQTKADAKSQKQLNAQLAEANRKLQKTLDKVENLTDKVDQTRKEAKAAADAANYAAYAAQEEKGGLRGALPTH